MQRTDGEGHTLRGVYGDEWLGRLNGVSVILVGVGGAATAWLVGLVAEMAGGFVVALAVIALLQAAALFLVIPFAPAKLGAADS